MGRADAFHGTFWKTSPERHASPMKLEIQEDVEFDFSSSSEVQGSNLQPICLTADIYLKFVKDEIDAVQMETDNADPTTIRQYNSSYFGDKFSGFREYSMEEIHDVLIQSPVKTCSLDPIPTSVLLESIEILLPFICMMCNSSLSEG